MRFRVLAFLAVGLAGAGCWPGPEVGPLLDTPGSTISGSSAPFSELQSRLFKPDCASTLCHTGNPPTHAPLSLDDGLSYEGMVNRPASQAPSILLVAPGAPEQSYLMLKLLGTVGSSGTVSTRMPLNQPSVDTARLEAVRSWILRGAPND